MEDKMETTITLWFYWGDIGIMAKWKLPLYYGYTGVILAYWKNGNFFYIVVILG